MKSEHIPVIVGYGIIGLAVLTVWLSGLKAKKAARTYRTITRSPRMKESRSMGALSKSRPMYASRKAAAEWEKCNEEWIHRPGIEYGD